jgi:hypothetical protein
MAREKQYARTFGQDLMRGEHKPGGGDYEIEHV